jgi:hypothetical protein
MGVMGRMRSLLIALAALMLLAGCIGRTGEVRANLGSEVSLAIGETAVVTGENLRVRFLAVTEDSRCPANVLCIQAGRAVMTVQVTYRGNSETVTLEEPGLTTPPESVYQNYELAFHLEPYPMAGVEVHPNQYRLLLTITRR